MTKDARILLLALARDPASRPVRRGDLCMTLEQFDAAGLELQAGITVVRRTTGDVTDPAYELATPDPFLGANPR